MLRTRFCELVGIEHPIVQASLGPMTSVELAAAVSNAGGLGSLGTALMSVEEIRRMVGRMRDLTSRPFVVNHTMRPLNEEAFRLTLDLAPPVISLALGDPGDLVKQAHDAGILFVQQVHTVEQARQAAERGVDVIIAQGSEAGGFSGEVSALALAPQVVDAVRPIPVLAAGGIGDGRGLAAALVLGAQGVNLGTRFLASREATISEDWKAALVAARSEETVKMGFAGALFPKPPGGYEASPRTLPRPFIVEWNGRLDEAQQEAERLRGEMVAALKQGRAYDVAPFTGQSAGLIQEVLPAGEIVRGLVAEAEAALRQGMGVLR